MRVFSKHKSLAYLKGFEVVREILNKNDSAIFVGVSGGADSLSLAAVTFDACSIESRSKLYAIIINHNLLKNSDKVADSAKTELKKIGYENIIIKNVTVKRSKNGLEADARKARYVAFSKTIKHIEEANGLKSSVLFLAHTSNDILETFILKLIRGSGLKVFKGISKELKYVYKGFEYIIIRPFLKLNRKETESICKLFKLKVYYDPTNKGKSKDPLRSIIRNNFTKKLIKSFPGILANCYKTSIINDSADILLDDISLEYENKPLLQIPDFLRWKVIAKMANSITKEPVKIETVWKIDSVLIKNLKNGGSEMIVSKNVKFKRVTKEKHRFLVCYNNNDIVIERLIK